MKSRGPRVDDERRRGGEQYTFKVEMLIDGKTAGTSNLPTNYVVRKDIPFWKYKLAPGPHKVEWKVLNPTPKAEIRLDNAIIYGDKPIQPKY